MANDASRDPRLNRLTPQEQDIVQVSFDSFSVEQEEVDEQGEKVFKKYITKEKLEEAFEYIGAASDIADIKMLINDVDENGDGKIDFDEWLSIMGKKFLGEDDDASTVHVFSMLDDNKDGFIPLVELRSLLMREGQAPLSEQEVDELLMFADSDSDGLVNYRTFLTWLANPEQVKKRAPAVTEQQGGRTRDNAGGVKAAKAGDLRASATGDLGAQSGAPDNEFGAAQPDAPGPASSTAAGRPQQERRPRPGAGEATTKPATTPPEGTGPSTTESNTAAPAAGGANDRAAVRAQRQAREKEKAATEKAERERKRQERQAAHQAKTAGSATGSEPTNEPQ